jgi:HK97 family phage major capsid protein/HK97 family phage prohead protease
MEKRYAHSVMDINTKSMREDPKTGRTYFEGIASTPTPDRSGDIVNPMGAEFTLPMALLYQHDAERPIGMITEAKPNAKGIPVKGYIESVDGPPSLKERLDVARTELKTGLVRGLSIGFIPKAATPVNPKEPWGAQNFSAWEWAELSTVTIPMNAQANVTMVKSLDQTQRAALGHTLPRSDGETTSPGATGTQKDAAFSVHINIPSKGKKMTYAEQIGAYEASRAAKAARVAAIMQGASDDGNRTLTETEAEEYDNLQAEVKSTDTHLVRLREQEKAMPAKATPAQPEKAQPRSAAGDFVLRPNANLPKGIGLARYVKALAYAKGNNAEAQNYAKQWDDSTPEVSLALKAAVAAGTTADSAWAGPLVYNQNMASEFLSYLRPQTIIGKMNGFRRVPFNIRYATQTSGSTVGWVGEGLGKPVSKLQLSSATLGFAKAAGIVVITQELARFSSPAAEMLVRDDLSAQMVYFLDQQFIDPGVAAVSAVNPASITNGAGNVRQAAAAWTSQTNVLTDIKAFLQGFADNNILLDSSSVWIMTPSAALALSMLVTTNGVQAFPNITLDGGSLFGIPVITSNSIPASVSAGSIVALVKASEIMLADDDGIAIDVSQEASLLMDSAPTTQTSATPTGSSVVSMFQTNSLAIRCERVINWSRRRSYAVGYIDNMHTS